jgi:predicted ArsR family transcriptional regulator
MAADLLSSDESRVTAVASREPGADRRRIARTQSSRTERLRRAVLDVLAARPAGLTADEIAAALDESVLAVRPRVSELFHAGLIEKTGERRRNQSGLSAHVWKKRAAGAS